MNDSWRLVNHDKTMDESVHANTPAIFNWESRTGFKRFNHRASDKATFSSKDGVVNGVSGANMALIPSKKMDDSQDPDKMRTYTTAVYQC